MKDHWILVVFILQFLSPSHEESEMKDIDVKLKDEFKSNYHNFELHEARQLGDSNAKFALDLYREFTAESEIGMQRRFINLFQFRGRPKPKFETPFHQYLERLKIT